MIIRKFWGGTYEYRAPETYFLHFNPFISECWSLGVLLYILVSEKYPFGYGAELRTSDGMEKHYYSMLTKDWNVNERIQNDNLLYSLLCQLLNPEPLERISIEQILVHPWFGRSKIKSAKIRKIFGKCFND